MRLPEPRFHDEAMLSEAFSISEQVYELLQELPEEEQYDIRSRWQTAAVDLIYYMAQAVAEASPSSQEYDWSNVRKQLQVVKTLYQFAAKQDYFDLEPAFMVQVTKLAAAIDQEVIAAYEQTKRYNDEELAGLREKYALSTETIKQVER